MGDQKDMLIELFEQNPNILQLLGRAWEILYFEGNAPDVGKRRENFIIQMLRKEFDLNVEQAPDTEREWDFKIILDKGAEKYYSLKTTEGYSTVKLAWDGFPTKERILNFEFWCSILYVVGNRKKHVIEVSVIDVDALKELRNETIEDESKLEEYWWIPKSGTNPRGFGLKGKIVKKLVDKAKEKGNHISASYTPLPSSKIKKLKEIYFEEWYELIKRIALEEE